MNTALDLIELASRYYEQRGISVPWDGLIPPGYHCVVTAVTCAERTLNPNNIAQCDLSLVDEALRNEALDRTGHALLTRLGALPREQVIDAFISARHYIEQKMKHDES